MLNFILEFSRSKLNNFAQCADKSGSSKNNSKEKKYNVVFKNDFLVLSLSKKPIS
jgi:hypothetical protein